MHPVRRTAHSLAPATLRLPTSPSYGTETCNEWELNMVELLNVFIDGEWLPSTGQEWVEDVNPSTEEVLARVPTGTAADVDAAVQAARKAFVTWRSTPLEERLEFVARILAEMESRHDELVRLVTAEVGTPTKIADFIQVGLALTDLRQVMKSAAEIEWEERAGTSLVLKEPVGVAGCITPWNFPLHQITAKVGAALVAGCTIVLKAPEGAPLCGAAFAEAVDAAGLPAGVFNLVHGTGATGEAIVAHPGVDVISFTGSTDVGKRVLEVASSAVKRVGLELGGKSASIILDDADFAVAVKSTVRSCFLNGGQACIARSRLVVPRARLAEVEALAVAAASSYVPTDPTDESARLGPMSSQRHRDRVLAYVKSAVADGIRMVAGSVDQPSEPATGYYVQPAIFSDVPRDAVIAQEEIFGPVLSIFAYEDEADAIEIANDSRFGLAASVWSADQDRAIDVARRLESGQVEINGGKFNPRAPFGGVKESGLGREAGRFGIEEFLEVKSLQL